MSNIPKELDKNMIVSADAEGLVWYDAASAPFELYGFAGVEGDTYRRLPKEVAEATNPGTARNASHTCGGRVRFSTDSNRIAIRVKMPYMTKYDHMPMTGAAAFDMYEDFENSHHYVCTFRCQMTDTEGYTSKRGVAGGKMRNYTINFPLYSPVSALEIGIDEGAKLGEGAKYRQTPPIVYYGSSITQGACASRPGIAYQSIISRRNEIDFVNLGFSGNAKGEQSMADYIAALPMTAFVCDYDHNAPNAEHLKATHYNFYKTIREKNPKLPIIFVSKPDFDNGFEASVERRRVIEDTFYRAREEGDPHVFYIDGQGLYRGYHKEECSTDGSHPNDIGMMKMAESIGQLLERVLRSRI
jgi:lysophospholipase L1-like esterase